MCSSLNRAFTVLKIATMIREKTRMLDFFRLYLLLRYKVIGVLKNFGER